MHARVKYIHEERSGKHFYIYLEIQVVMEYLKLSCRNSKHARRNSRERQILMQEFRFNYIASR